MFKYESSTNNLVSNCFSIAFQIETLGADEFGEFTVKWISIH